MSNKTKTHPDVGIRDLNMSIFRKILIFIGMAAAVAAHAEQAKVVSDAISSAEWMAKALSSSGYKADFSIESLKEIDRFFDDQAPNGNAKSDGLLGQGVGLRLFAIGSYVGEVVRRKAGGVWEGNDSDPQAEINISVRLSDGTIIWPVQRVMKRFKNGAEDGVYVYGLLVTTP